LRSVAAVISKRPRDLRSAELFNKGINCFHLHKPLANQIVPILPRVLATDLQIGITSNTSSTNDYFCKFPLRKQTT
jgi:hypothetical protein